MKRPYCPAHAVAAVRNCWVVATVAVVGLSVFTTFAACAIAHHEGWSTDALTMFFMGGLPWLLGVRAELEYACFRLRHR